jgi:cytochrome P450
MVNYGAGNVDPSEFPDPFEVRFDRQPNRHIACSVCTGASDRTSRRELRRQQLASSPP